MKIPDLEARIRRLDELTHNFAREVGRWKEGEDPLSYLERKAYLGAIQDAIAGAEAARVVLAKGYPFTQAKNWLVQRNLWQMPHSHNLEQT